MKVSDDPPWDRKQRLDSVSDFLVSFVAFDSLCSDFPLLPAFAVLVILSTLDNKTLTVAIPLLLYCPVLDANTGPLPARLDTTLLLTRTNVFDCREIGVTLATPFGECWVIVADWLDDSVEDDDEDAGGKRYGVLRVLINVDVCGDIDVEDEV